MKKFSAFLLSACFSALTFAGTSATVTPGPWDLYRGSTIAVQDLPTEAACVDAAKGLNVSRTYTCRTRTNVVVTVTVDPPPTCTTPKPADETRPGTCPTGTSGTWQQTRGYVTADYPQCWSAGPWVPDVAPSGTCVQDPPPVDPPPSGQVITVSPGQSVSAAVAQLNPGGTVVIKPGTYSGGFSLKACNASAWCTVKAETDGTVTMGNIEIGAGNWYTRIEGLKFKGSGGSAIMGSYVKVLRTAFEGGASTGNDVSLQIGTNDRTPGASNILLEDVWVYGLGGRYKALVYNSDSVVLRRVLVRHDGGWTYDGQNPQGGITIYDSKNVAAQDVSCVDSKSGLNGFESCIYLVSNGTTSIKQANVSVNGALIIGSPNNGLGAEGNGGAATYTLNDIAVVGSVQGGLNTNNSGHIINATGVFTQVSGAPYGKWASGGSLKVANCVYKPSSNSGASLTNCAALPVGWKYITAQEGGRGANIAKKIGVSGTLFGEPGYADVLTEDLWPYPNEDRIKADLDSVRPAFGGKTYTKYVWEQLGTASPF